MTFHKSKFFYLFWILAMDYSYSATEESQNPSSPFVNVIYLSNYESVSSSTPYYQPEKTQDIVAHDGKNTNYCPSHGNLTTEYEQIAYYMPSESLCPPTSVVNPSPLFHDNINVLYNQLTWLPVENSLLNEHYRIHMLDPDRATLWISLERKIIECMVDRIKKMCVCAHNGPEKEYLFENYTYTDDSSLLLQMVKWNSYDMKCIAIAKLSLAETHVLAMKIEPYDDTLPIIALFLRNLLSNHIALPSRAFDIMYSFCVLRAVDFSRLNFSMSFKENYLERLDETQFMKLFNTITALSHKDRCDYMHSCLGELVPSLSLNRNFLLSSANAFLIAKSLLCARVYSTVCLVFSESIRRAITLGDTFALLKCIRENNSHKDPVWFLKFYFFFTLKFKGENGTSQQVRRLHKAFIKKYRRLFGCMSIPEASNGFPAIYSSRWYNIRRILRHDVLWYSHGIEVPMMLFEVHQSNVEECVNLNEELFYEPWMKSYLTCLYKDNKLEDLISKIGKGEIFQSRYFNVLLCELEHIILNPAYNMNVFLRLFRATMENSNILLQILVLLTGAKFLKFNEIRDELIKILDEVKHPGSIYLPYIGNMYCLRHRNCTPNTFWSVEEFIEAVDSSFLLEPITRRRVFYYLRLIFIYENTCFYNNFRIFVISILKMRNIKKRVKRDVLSSLASSEYYRRLVYFNLNNIMTQICVHRLMNNYKMLRKTLSNILSNYDFSFQHDDALFPTIVSFCS